MPTLALLLVPILLASPRAPHERPRPTDALIRGPIRSLCLPPTDSATTPRRQVGPVSFQPPAGFGVVSSTGDLQLFESGERSLAVTDAGDRSILTRSDFLGRVSCRATINGRGVTVTTGTIELEASEPLAGPGIIGVQHIAVAEWDQLVAGRPVMLVAIGRTPQELEPFRPTIYSVRLTGDSTQATPTLADFLPHWAAVRVDTISGLELETQAMGGNVRFVARSVGGDVAVTTPELEPDSVRAWSAAIDQLATAPTPGIHALGSSVAATAVSIGGKPAVALSFGEETSDQQVSLALTPADAARLAGALRAAVGAVRPAQR